jgi:hypothetical protein
VGAAAATDVGTADAGTITDGTGDAVTTNGVTIAAGKAFVAFASVIPIALATRECQQLERSRRRGAAGSVITEKDF